MNAPKASASITFALKSVLCQTVAASIAFIIWPLIPSFCVILTASTACSYALSRFLDLPLPWRVANSLLPGMALASLLLEIPSWLFASPLVVLLLIYAPALWTRVPYYPTPKAAYALILADLPRDKPIAFLDIGCGFGDLLMFLSEHRPQARFVGIELAFFPWLVAWFRKTLAKQHNVSVRFKDIWACPLGEFDYVYAFLSPAVMTRIWEKAKAEMPEGSIFIANAFPAPAPCDDEIRVKDGRDSRLYVYRMQQKQRAAHSVNS